MLLTGMIGTYYWCQSIGITHGKDQYQSHYIIDKTGGSKRLRAVLSGHDRVGQSLYNGTDLSDDDGKPQCDKGTDMVFVT